MKNINLLFIISFFLLSSCSKRECCVNYDTGISIKYLNKKGENLFEIENGYKISEINIYHKKDNKWVKYFKGNLDDPKGIKTYKKNDSTYFSISPSTTIVNNNISETKIEFSTDDFDIIKTEINNKNSNTRVYKVWYNDTLKWKGYKTERLFQIIK